MNENEINLDALLDYKEIYQSIVQKPRITGSQLLGLCPVHQEKTPSFSVDLKTGMCRCFSCGFTGNFISLYAQMHGIDKKAAFEEICKEYHIEKPTQKKETKTKKTALLYTLEEYAKEKNLPRAFLEQFFNLKDHAFRGSNSVEIPYFTADGKLSATRYRHHPQTDPRFTWSKGSKTCLYGLHFMDSIKESGSVILVEGESDTHTLTFLGFSALGVPGASTFKTEEAEMLQGVKVYIHVEPDQGGQVFLKKTTDALRSAGFEGEVFRFSCSDLGEKDPSDLYKRDGSEKTADEIADLLDNAKKVDLYEPEPIPESIKGAPVNLHIPAGYTVNDNGIFVETKDKDLIPICATPMLISKSVTNVDTHDNKIEITVKKGGVFRSTIIPRSNLNNNAILAIADSTQANISSANAKHIIKYLTQLDGENQNTIPHGESISRFGWIGDDRFLPYHAENISYEFNEPALANACKLKGTLENWCKVMQPHRQRDIFRFILSASFAAPLLRVLKVRSFVVYNWATSKGGKTAGLKASLSVWGEPEKLLMTFNGTKNAIERRAISMCDLPLGIDEKQQADKHLNPISVIYNLGNETQRARCDVKGNNRAVATWKTIALATGEEPLPQNADGANNRYIELVGAPFISESEAAEMHKACDANYGVAGEKFMGYIIKKIQKDKQSLYKTFDMVKEHLKESTEYDDMNKLEMLALVGTADLIASMVIFEETKDQAISETVKMLKGIAKMLNMNKPEEVNILACSYIIDFYQANSNKLFNTDSNQELYGFLENFSNRLTFTRSSFEKTLQTGGFNAGKTLEFMKRKKLIDVDNRGYLKQKKINGINTRVISIDLNKMLDLINHVTKPEQMDLLAKMDTAEIMPF